MGVSVGVGGVPIFMPSNSIAGMPFNTILGRPVVICENSPALGTKGDIVLADFSNGYLLATKGNARIASKFILDLSMMKVHIV